MPKQPVGQVAPDESPEERGICFGQRVAVASVAGVPSGILVAGILEELLTCALLLQEFRGKNG